jgi:hypothetical protein
MSDTEEDPDDNPRKEKESDDTMEKVIHWPFLDDNCSVSLRRLHGHQLTNSQSGKLLGDTIYSYRLQ